MSRYVIVLGNNTDLFGDVRRTLLADSRFIDAGDTIHCDGADAPLTNICAVDMNPAEWRAGNRLVGCLIREPCRP